MTIPLPIFTPGKLYRRSIYKRAYKCLGNVEHYAVMQPVYGERSAGTDCHFMDGGGEPFLLNTKGVFAKEYREIMT